MESNQINHGRRLGNILSVMDLEKKELAKRLQIAPPSLSQWLKEYKFTDEKMERVCQALGITVQQFLEVEPIQLAVSESSVSYGSNANNANREIRMLKQLLEEKERTIQILLKQYCEEQAKQ